MKSPQHQDLCSILDLLEISNKKSIQPCCKGKIIQQFKAILNCFDLSITSMLSTLLSLLINNSPNNVLPLRTSINCMSIIFSVTNCLRPATELMKSVIAVSRTSPPHYHYALLTLLSVHFWRANCQKAFIRYANIHCGIWISVTICINVWHLVYGPSVFCKTSRPAAMLITVS